MITEHCAVGDYCRSKNSCYIT